MLLHLLQQEYTCVTQNPTLNAVSSSPEIKRTHRNTFHQPSHKPYAMSSRPHIIYHVIRPIDRPRDHLSSVHRQVSKISKGIADIGTLIAISLLPHGAVVVEGNYYHLKRLPDDTLALDLTPFTDESIFEKHPASRTGFSHAERLGIGECHTVDRKK